jgi:hypothetical protein
MSPTIIGGRVPQKARSFIDEIQRLFADFDETGVIVIRKPTAASTARAAIGNPQREKASTP